MRYKPEHKEETHRRIVESASKEFRSHGFDGVGINKLMGILNLTHGGFYAHFTDKEDLVTEALALALDESLEAMRFALEAGGLPAVLDYYLSEAHRDNPEAGCPLPALSAEVARRSPPARDALTKKLSAFFDTLAEQMPGQTFAQKRANVHLMFSALVGAVSLARTVSDSGMSRAILEATRENLLRLIGEKGA